MEFNEKYYKIINESDIEFFRSFLSVNQINKSEEKLIEFSQDYTGEFIDFKADLILIPDNTEQVSQILKYCNEKLIPVYIRAAGTSLSAATVPVKGGLILSMERFNKILHIDENNLQATVEPMVINEVFANYVEEFNLYYPPDPASRGTSTIGGNVGHNSGGPRCVKYGVTRDYILNLEVVLPNGKIIWTGSNTLKFSSGYNLTQLFIGSEGTLGVITKSVVKLIPKPKFKLLLRASFDNLIDAFKTVAQIFKAGVVPSACEFMERDALLYTNDFIGSAEVIPEWLQAVLLIEVDGQYLEPLYQDMETINTVLIENNCIENFFAESSADMDKLWFLRRRVGEAIRSQTIFKEEDCVVPRYNLPELIEFVKKLEIEYGFKSVCFGHAGDGNIHINILKTGLTEDFWLNGLKEPIRKLLLKTIELGGAISGEHGIGFAQKELLPLQFPLVHLNLQNEIKLVFDSNNILNPR